MEGERALISLLCLYSGVYQQLGSCCEQPRGKPALPNGKRWGIRSAHSISGQRAGKGSPAGSREQKKGFIIFCFYFLVPRQGPSHRPCPGIPQIHAAGISRRVFKPRSWLPAAPSDGALPSSEGESPQGAASVHVNQWERPPDKACTANSSAIPLTYVPDPITALPLAANFALLYLQGRHAALQHSLLKVSLQPRLPLPKPFFFKMVF